MNMPAHGCRSGGRTGGTCPPPISEKHELSPPIKYTLNYSKLNKCIFRLHILHIIDSDLLHLSHLSFKQVEALVRLLLMVPASSCNAERSFSPKKA